MEILLYILVPNIFVIIYLLKSPLIKGSDHILHVSWVDRIKNNKHRFIDDYMFSINEKYIWYPQLFHWLISFLPSVIYREKVKYINVAVKLIEIIAFNLFLLFLFQRLHFDAFVFFYANIVVNIFPFTYAVWNAKNSGLSPRSIGLVVGQMYSYCIFLYVFTGNYLWLGVLLILVFISMLLSLIAMQYIILSIPFLVFYFKIPEIILLPLFSFALYYLIMPEIAMSNLFGQFNHKRNYALFLAKIFILKRRPSIYRDFVYDFWVNLRKKVKSGLRYIYFNPIVEIIYGVPFLWFILYYYYNNNSISSEFDIMYKIVITALLLFILTSFSFTRFLGEPQRYLEFVFPIISIIFAFSFKWELQLSLMLFCFFVIFIGYLLFAPRPAKIKALQNSRDTLFNYLTADDIFKNSICISNDQAFLKGLAELDIRVLRPDAAIFYKNEKHFNKYFNNDFRELSTTALTEYVDNYSPHYLIINKNYYNFDSLPESIKAKVSNKLIEIGEFSLYKLQSNY